jgi:ATP-dependent RNA helicase DHX29
MVAKKGKKKIASNPARGFATTSIASKPKPDKKDADTSNEPSESQSSVSTPAPAEKSLQSGQPDQAQDHKVLSDKTPADRELHELSPEELEARLELSELQSFIEQQGPKVRKESARQVLRLKTDRRVLRGQADLLTVREWLPEELMQQIIELALDESLSTSAPPSVSASKRLSEDELLSRVWQLSIILADLDVPEHQVRKVLQYMLVSPPSEDSGALAWGLSEALDWLALNGQLLDYDAVKPKPQPSSIQMNNGKFASPHFLFLHFTEPLLIASRSSLSRTFIPFKPLQCRFNQQGYYYLYPLQIHTTRHRRSSTRRRCPSQRC